VKRLHLFGVEAASVLAMCHVPQEPDSGGSIVELQSLERGAGDGALRATRLRCTQTTPRVNFERREPHFQLFFVPRKRNRVKAMTPMLSVDLCKDGLVHAP
jgi:hypothetical protein